MAYGSHEQHDKDRRHMERQVNQNAASLNEPIVDASIFEIQFLVASEVTGPHVHIPQINVVRHESLQVLSDLVALVNASEIVLGLSKLDLIVITRAKPPFELVSFPQFLVFIAFKTHWLVQPLDLLHGESDLVIHCQTLPLFWRIMRHWEAPEDFFEALLEQRVAVSDQVRGGEEQDQKVEVQIRHLFFLDRDTKQVEIAYI